MLAIETSVTPADGIPTSHLKERGDIRHAGKIAAG
jgi:hypothetical protein